MKAFPTPATLNEQGMDLRNYFAAKAMQSFLIAHPKMWPVGFDASVSVAAYQMADAMMKARGVK